MCLSHRQVMSRVVTKVQGLVAYVLGGGGYYHIWAIKVCAAVKGMVFKRFTLRFAYY